MGQTASGKTALAEFLAQEWGAQLINADAFQMYRGMDIGTAKPSDPTRYALMDNLEPDQEYGVGEYVAAVQPILHECYAQQRDVILVGGTGLYIRALMDEWSEMQGAPDPELRAELDAQELDQLLEQLTRRDPEAAAKVDQKNKVRVRRALERALSPSQSIAINIPPYKKFKVALDWPVDLINERIDQRVQLMWDAGWIHEVSVLISNGFLDNCPGFRAIGYSQIAQHLRGRMSEDECTALIRAQTRAYAKRQRTWLRSERDLVFGSANPDGEWSYATVRAVFGDLFD